MAYLIKKTRFLDLDIEAIKMSKYKHFLTLLRSGQYSEGLTDRRQMFHREIDGTYSYGISQPLNIPTIYQAETTRHSGWGE